MPRSTCLARSHNVWDSDRDSIRLQFGRCSVPKYFEGGLKVLNDNRELFSTFVENKIRLDQATEVKFVGRVM